MVGGWVYALTSYQFTIHRSDFLSWNPFHTTSDLYQVTLKLSQYCWPNFSMVDPNYLEKFLHLLSVNLFCLEVSLLGTLCYSCKKCFLTILFVLVLQECTANYLVFYVFMVVVCFRLFSRWRREIWATLWFWLFKYLRNIKCFSSAIICVNFIPIKEICDILLPQSHLFMALCVAC